MSGIKCPQMLEAAPVSARWTVLASWMPVSGLGLLPVNSFLRKGREPMLVDTGLAALQESFMTALESEMDPCDLAWIWLSHMDADHAGNLGALLERAPNARVITTFLGAGKMQLAGIQTDRIRLLEAGESIDLDGSRFRAIRPPYYDAPERTGFFDEDTAALFVADSFGALLPRVASDLESIDATSLRAGMQTWSAIDAPWLADMQRSILLQTLNSLDALEPELILAGHLPVARRQLRTMTRIIAEAHRAPAVAESAPIIGMQRGESDIEHAIH